jgi:hypothetical protein
MMDEFLRFAEPLERAALERLRHPERYPAMQSVRPSSVVLRLFRFEGIGRYYAWMLAKVDGQYLVRRVVWDRPGDHRPGVLDPTTFGSDGLLPPDTAEFMRADFQQSCAATVPDSSIGLDGVSYGIETGAPWPSSRLEWWSGASTAHPAEEWFRRVASTLDGVLPGGSEAGQAGA